LAATTLTRLPSTARRMASASRRLEPLLAITPAASIPIAAATLPLRMASASSSTLVVGETALTDGLDHGQGLGGLAARQLGVQQQHRRPVAAGQLYRRWAVVFAGGQ
jgi:hypothetical protein